MNAKGTLSTTSAAGLPSTALRNKVAMPAAATDQGNPGDYAVDTNKLAVYVASVGWEFYPGLLIGPSGTIPPEYIGTGTRTGLKFLRDDGAFVTLSGGGDLVAANNLGDVGSFASARANLSVYSQAEVAAQRNALAPAQALQFHGTAGSTIGNLPAFGTGDFSVSVRVNPTALGSVQAVVSGLTNSFGLLIDAAGSPYTLTVANIPNTHATGAISAGAVSQIDYVRSGTTGTYYINGVAAGTTTDAQNYSVDSTYLGNYGTPNYYVAGTLHHLGIENRALSASEVFAVYQTGSFPASDFGASGAPAGTTVTAGAFVIGKKYRIASVGTTSFTSLGASANTVGVEFTATGVGSGSGTAVAIGLLVALESNAPGNGLIWGDRSGNGAHILLPTSGVDWLLPSAAVNKLRGTTSTSGNQQLLGGTTLNANTQITRVRARSRSGTPSITLGTAPGESQIVASVALSTTWKDLTIALTGGIISTASSVWVGSSTAAVVEIDITHEPLGY